MFQDFSSHAACLPKHLPANWQVKFDMYYFLFAKCFLLTSRWLAFVDHMTLARANVIQQEHLVCQ